MKNLFKKSLQKSQIFLLLFLFGCQSLDLKLANSDPYNEPDFITHRSNNQFESRSLKTLKMNKKKIKVALFLPFSGKHKELGWHLFNAATMSLFDNDLNNSIELVLIDSKDTPQDAKRAFKEIVRQNIKIVIGPVFTRSINAIKDDVEDHDIVALSLSNNQKLMGKVTNDSGIFLSGLLPESQIEKIVSFAISQKKTNFAIIAPNNQYGITMAKLLKKVVKSRDGNFVTSEFYRSNGRNLNRAVKRTINSFTVPSHLAEGRGNKLPKDFVVKESDKSYPQVILIPESGRHLSRVVTSIKNQNKIEREFQLVGTSQWDDISTLNNPKLVGSWFVAPESVNFTKFEKRYYNNFEKFPPRISSIAYDSVIAVAKLIERNSGRNVELEDFINYKSAKNGFEGIDGLFRYLPNGLVQRNLAVLQVDEGEFTTIDKPAEKFLNY